MADNKLSLGDFLRQERERQGITIEQVASATKIGVRFLHLLEADHYAELPAKPFIRGFVISYSRFVGLDHKEVLTRFGDFIDQKAHDRPTRDAGHSGYAFEKREGEQSRTMLWFVMGGFVAVGGVVMVFLKPSLHHHHGSHIEKLRSAYTEPEPSPSVPASPLALAAAATIPEALPSVMAPVAPAPEPQSSERPSPSPITGPADKDNGAPATNAAAPAADPLNSGLDLLKLKPKGIRYKLVIRAVDDVWVRYRVDDKPSMKFVLRKDKLLVLRALKGIRFQATQANAVDFSFNGSDYKHLSDESSVVLRQDHPTLFYPAQLAGSSEEIFPDAPAHSAPSASLSTPSP